MPQYAQDRLLCQHEQTIHDILQFQSSISTNHTDIQDRSSRRQPQHPPRPAPPRKRTRNLLAPQIPQRQIRRCLCRTRPQTHKPRSQSLQPRPQRQRCPIRRRRPPRRRPSRRRPSRLLPPQPRPNLPTHSQLQNLDIPNRRQLARNRHRRQYETSMLF